MKKKNLPIFKETSKWLDIYFSGKNPDFMPKYKINTLTPFRQEIIDIMNIIPYASTITYNDISKIIAQKSGIKRMSSQAVGGDINNKAAPLSLEKVDMNKYFIPKKGTAL